MMIKKLFLFVGMMMSGLAVQAMHHTDACIVETFKQSGATYAFLFEVPYSQFTLEDNWQSCDPETGYVQYWGTIKVVIPYAQQARVRAALMPKMIKDGVASVPGDA